MKRFLLKSALPSLLKYTHPSHPLTYAPQITKLPSSPSPIYKVIPLFSNSNHNNILNSRFFCSNGANNGNDGNDDGNDDGEQKEEDDDDDEEESDDELEGVEGEGEEEVEEGEGEDDGYESDVVLTRKKRREIERWLEKDETEGSEEEDGEGEELTPIDDKELDRRINEYLNGSQDMLESVAEAILVRCKSGKYEKSHDRLLKKLQTTYYENVDDETFFNHLSEGVSTDKDIEDLYNPMENVQKEMLEDEYFNVDYQKWDELVKEGVEHGYIKDTKECEDILEDMLKWDNVLPDVIQKKIKKKHIQLNKMMENQEITPEKATELFHQFEEKMVEECSKILEAEEPPFDEDQLANMQHSADEPDDPPGEGPILRWQTRVVMGPGDSAWHPKNRKVKLSVTVKELGFSEHAMHRLMALVGKRYNVGKDELTITSERFDYREENRKDCLRTLYSLIAEAMQADKLVEEAQASYFKDQLRASPKFMKKLKAKTIEMQKSSVTALPA